MFSLAVAAEEGEILVGRQFRGRPAERDERGAASVQTSGRPVLSQQKPEQRDRVSSRKRICSGRFRGKKQF